MFDTERVQIGKSLKDLMKTHVDHVIKRAMLRDSNEDRLVVRRGVDRGQAVHTRGETRSDVCTDNAINRGGVDTLEECEDAGVRRGGLVDRVQFLNDDVRVADDGALCIDLLGRGVVVGLSVHERAGLDVVDRHVDCEGLVGWDRTEVRWERELRGRHVRRRSDNTHGRLPGA